MTVCMWLDPILPWFDLSVFWVSVISPAWLLLCLNFLWKELVVYIVLLVLDSGCSWADNIYLWLDPEFLTLSSEMFMNGSFGELFFGFCLSMAPTHIVYRFILTLYLSLLYHRYGEGNGNPLQYSCLGNPMDRGAWQFRLSTSHRKEMQLWTPEMPLEPFHCLVTPRWTMEG